MSTSCRGRSCASFQLRPRYRISFFPTLEIQMPLPPEFDNPQFKKALTVRCEVLGAEYVDKSVQQVDDFMKPMQKMTTEWCWGEIWTRPLLDRKTRSIINLAMLSALNRPNEVRLHVRGALNNGLSVAEIQEVLLRSVWRSPRCRPAMNRSAASAASIMCCTRMRSSSRILHHSGPHDFFAKVAAEILRRTDVDSPPTEQGGEAPLPSWPRPGVREPALARIPPAGPRRCRGGLCP